MSRPEARQQLQRYQMLPLPLRCGPLPSSTVSRLLGWPRLLRVRCHVLGQQPGCDLVVDGLGHELLLPIKVCTECTHDPP